MAAIQTDAYNLRIEGPPKDARFYMSTVPTMPSITFSAKIDNVLLPQVLPFKWEFTLDYQSYITTAPGQKTVNVRTKSHPPIPPMMGPSATVTFSTLMCGRLTVRLSTMMGAKILMAERNDILIGGTNPSTVELSGAVPEAIVRKLIKHESSGYQFYDGTPSSALQAINPYWSRDGLKGVGLGQLTNPAPSDGDIWNWRTNATSLKSRFQKNRTGADGFAKAIQNSARFTAEQTALNAWRKAENQPAITLTVPALTADQRDAEALRRYNGLGPAMPEADCYLYASDTAGNVYWRVHEFEPETAEYTSATRKAANGTPLKTTLLKVGTGDTIVWKQITGAERSKRYAAAGKTKGLGDPDYVANVLKKVP